MSGTGRLFSTLTGWGLKLDLYIRTSGKLGVRWQVTQGLLLIHFFLHQQVLPKAQFHEDQETPKPQAGEGHGFHLEK